jgi:hypothetical protein
MRIISLALFVLVGACGQPKTPTPPAAGFCNDGAMLGGQEISCNTACVRDDKGPRCVAVAEAPQKEACGIVACGDGCSCASDPPNACICPKLGPP